MKIIISHLTGNSNVKAALGGFHRAKLLGRFYVSFATYSTSIWHKSRSLPLFSELKRRKFERELKPFIKISPWREIGRIFAKKMGFSRLVNNTGSPFHIDSVVRALDEKVAKDLDKISVPNLRFVYGYEDTALYSFQRARELGLQCLYDLPIGYWRSARRLLKSQMDALPEWAATIPSFKDGDLKLRRKDEEISLSHHIFVASSFTAGTLKEYPESLPPITIIPYGFPPINRKRKYSSIYQKRLKLLFVGSLSQRKGIANLFGAINKLDNHVELTLVGEKTTKRCEVLNKTLLKYKWYPYLTHDEVLYQMSNTDVLVFPSLFEGFGLVITEAMSQGTPVITTERTAGPDIIKNEENGWIVEAESTEALRSAIEQLLIRRELVQQAGLQAMEKARSRPWKLYGEELAQAVLSLC